METFQKLTILLPTHEKKEFFHALEEKISHSDWKIRNDLIHNYKKNSFTGDKDVLCAESPKFKYDNRTIGGLLWLWDYSGYYEIFNIIPTESSSLSFREYNYILNEFYSKFIEELKGSFEATIALSKPEKLIIETIGDDAYKALQRFSLGANKTTGNTHPFDFDRWCQFIFIVFRKQIGLNSDELETWFLENGWDEDMASKLSSEFEYSINLLEKYEPNK